MLSSLVRSDFFELKSKIQGSQARTPQERCRKTYMSLIIINDTSRQINRKCVFKVQTAASPEKAFYYCLF